MQYTIVLHDIAIGTVDLELGGLTGGAVHPLPGYERIRSLVRDAALATQNLGFLGAVDDPASTERAEAVFNAHRALLDALELRDAAGGLVPCEFIEVTEGPGDSSPFVFVSLDDTPDDARARPTPIPRDDRHGAARRDV